MQKRLKLGLIFGSLPSYFPSRHGVWDKAEKTLAEICAEHSCDLYVVPDIPMDARQTQNVLDHCANVGVDFLLLLHGGFTMGDVARTIAASPFRAGFWSVPEPVRTGDVQLNNFVSLNMSMSIARGVRDLRSRPVQWYHAAPESAAFRRKLGNTLKALSSAKQLQGARIGVVGGLAMTFYNMEVSSNALRARLGVDVAHYDIHELTGRMKALSADRVTSELNAMRAAAKVDGVTDAQMSLQAQCALALRDIASEGSCDALAVSDWPALQVDPGMHPGAAFSWLEENDALPVASEGDVLGAITQIVAKSLTGKVGCLLDLTEPDLDAGELLVWHGGGGPLHLANGRGARWINHPMIGRGTPDGAKYGAIADYVFEDGPVTLLRIGRDAGAIFHMTAIARAREPSGFSGCRGWLHGFDIAGETASLEDAVATVMAHGLEHHFVLVQGDHSAAVAEFGSWCSMVPLSRLPIRDHLQTMDFS